MRFICALLVLCAFAGPVAGQGLPDDRIAEAAPDSFKVAFETSKGPFDVVVYRAWSPYAADRFYHLVRLGFYDGVSLFRVVAGYVVQFGISNDAETNRAWRPRGLIDEPVLAHNARGTISFARGGPNTRTTQVFINLSDNAMLDNLVNGGVRGYPPFGRVVSGMDEVVAMFNADYGNAPAMRQDSINVAGRAFLDRAFPGLDYVVRAKLVDF
ncbi:MAG: peptidylprolyl isomerase [Rhodothermales bacterium]